MKKKENNKVKEVSMPTIRRLPLYLSFLNSLKKKEKIHITASEISRELYIDSTQITKDFSAIQVRGKTRIGYEIINLIDEIETFLGYHIHRKAFIAGVGNLGTALTKFTKFYDEGIEIIKGFEIDSKKIGNEINDIKIFNIASISEHFNITPVDVGIIAVPNNQAQEVADIMVSCGIKALWNFTTMPLSASNEIIIENTCIDSSLAIIKWKLNKNKPLVYKNRII